MFSFNTLLAQYQQNYQQLKPLVQSLDSQQQVEDSPEQSHSPYLFQDDWIRISEAPLPSGLTMLQSSEFEQDKKQLFDQISAPEQKVDFLYLTPFAETLLQKKEEMSQAEILNQIIAFLRVAEHPWNRPNQADMAYGVWSKANRQLLAFSNSFCSIHSLSKEFLSTHPFFHEDFAFLPPTVAKNESLLQDFKKDVVEVLELIFSSHVFYYESTQPCRGGAYCINRSYYLPNSLFFISIYETCNFFSDCFVLDGLKFEPTFIAKPPHVPFEKMMQYKFAKFKQILSQYKNLFAKKSG